MKIESSAPNPRVSSIRRHCRWLCLAAQTADEAKFLAAMLQALALGGTVMVEPCGDDPRRMTVARPDRLGPESAS